MTIAYSGGASILSIRQNTGNLQLWYSGSGTYTSTILALSTNTWYFWAIAQGATSSTAWAADASTELSGAGASVTIGTQTFDTLRMMTYLGSTRSVAGFNARVRGWGSVLGTTDFNAERLSATAVGASPIFDAPFTSTSDLGGFTITGTLVAGP
jgi:hypothetical protein